LWQQAWANSEQSPLRLIIIGLIVPHRPKDEKNDEDKLKREKNRFHPESYFAFLVALIGSL
jgi:hypothetical protein